MFQGEGRVEWSNGAYYAGSFAAGLFSGKGLFRAPSGDVIEGRFEYGLPNGEVTLKSNNGAYYQGQARAGMLEGRGRLEDKGSIYEGEFKNNAYHGQGHLLSPTQEYTGEFRQGLFWGAGELRQNNGRSYKGGFVRGEFEGRGIYAMPKGPSYEGDFAGGVFQGQGRVVFPDGAVHEGRFLDWRPDGHGKYTDAEGNVFEGEFKAGQLQGKARVTRQDGTRYEGELQGWMPHGQGELHLANGDVYKGGFSYGMYDGQGSLTYAKPQDGRSRDVGEWTDGRLKKQVEDERRRRRENVEQAFYTQAGQIQQALRQLKPGPTKGIGMYLLAVAGHGSQEVFRREVDFVRSQFESRFALRGHAVVLTNSRNTVASRPLATLTSVRRAVSAIAAKMDKERDILFLFLTSHGAKEGGLSLEFEGVNFPDLTPGELASILKASGIRWKVVVISACYSGRFLEPLKDSGTLVITAARADRTSFGCSDENDFTYFGRAFFKESLPAATSFEDAFARADRLIRKWEDRDAAAAKPATGAAADESKNGPAADQHSLPQIDAPLPIREQLKRWWAQYPQISARRNAQ